MAGDGRELNREEEKVVEEFIEKLIENTEDLSPEFSELIDKHFWELVDGD